jgi:long-subunit acyl-CoA synthetase (AMP-forming)/N-acetylglutamate synthase-like GNAT family acetyltransferase
MTPPETLLAALGALTDDQELDDFLEHLPLEELDALAVHALERLRAEGDAPSTDARREAWEILDVVRRSAVLQRIAAARAVDAWAARILELVEASHYTTGVLFRRRAERYGSKTLFEIPAAGGWRSLSWRHTAARVEALARGLLATLGPDAPPRVAILSENRPEMATADLACFCAGIVTVIIPANSTEADVAYMLRHAGAGAVLVSDREQLRKVTRQREALPGLRHVFVMDAVAAGKDAVALDEVSSRAGQVPVSVLEERVLATRTGDLATVMYTSGTTGKPKGIRFTHRNIVYKRFCRALALPEIGEDDVFLCYLPLFHTFGRYFEMMGCVFWGATYCFLENPSIEAMVQGMRRFRPTVFISVPKKWIQLYETIALEAPPDSSSDEAVLEATRRLTGGRLRWGLSAAGHLDSSIFRFFQQQGVELMSGFGMTEATGGITMTPPGKYRDDSLGLPLPGITCRLAEDGELWIRGPYVTEGYLDLPEGEEGIAPDGWLRTGDLMEKDHDGHIRLVDRKKEIYKNVKGETIAPQRIEGLFREFESVGRVFLVGDHREYNTALIYPNPKATHVDLAALADDEERKGHFRSIVASVNAFLAPFERIVDFSVIDRDFDPHRGELTSKGSYRRKAIEANFAPAVALLYRRANLRVAGADVVFPNWLFQALGLTAQDLQIESDRLVLPGGKALHVRRLQDGVTLVGSIVYAHPAHEALQIGVLLTTPRLWLGNDELVDFADLEIRLRERPGRAGDRIEWRGRATQFPHAPAVYDALQAQHQRADLDLMDLHRAALLLAGPDDKPAIAAVHVLERAMAQEEGPLAEPARILLGRVSTAPSLAVRRKAFLTLLPAERPSRVRETLRRFLSTPGVILDAETRRSLCERNLDDVRLEAFLAEAEHLASTETVPRGVERRLASVLRLLAEYGAAHPTRYRKLRAAFVRLAAFASLPDAREEAARMRSEMRKGFRAWMGPSSRVGVDPETGQEYRWDDVVTFDEDVPEDDRRRLLSAIRTTPVIREAVFLFSGGAMPRLSDIPPGGVWVRTLGSKHGKNVYRVTVQTRFQGSYDLALNVNHELPAQRIQDEIRWLILCGDTGDRPPLVEDFGGYWPEFDLWSEEYIPGDTLDRVLKRLSRHANDEDRFKGLWPFFAWSALAAHLDFWNRTGRTVEVADPAGANVIVPTHDYQTGARLVSISSVREHKGLAETFRFFREEFTDPLERRYPTLQGEVRWNVVLSALLEAVGEQEGLRMLRELQHRDADLLPDGLAATLATYIPAVEAHGFLPMRLYFAIRRYRRWAKLSIDPTPSACARNVQELWDTYGLSKLIPQYPGARLRFFRQTVFESAPEPLAMGLEEIHERLRRRELPAEALPDAIADLRARIEVGPEEDYFLARLSFPYLRPEDAAGFVQTDFGGRHQSEIVVTLEDGDGNPFQVRHALTPKEVGRLHRLFLSAKLDVRFRPEHQYLVAINERQQIIGGIFYDVEPQARSAHLEKIVVGERYRKKRVADGLMHEFFNRLRAQGMKTVTTGFFRPEYFYAYGFAIEKRYAGLVKNLAEGTKG